MVFKVLLISMSDSVLGSCTHPTKLEKNVWANFFRQIDSERRGPNRPIGGSHVSLVSMVCTSRGKQKKEMGVGMVEELGERLAH